ncbi:hypothetical protein LCGC14_2004880, partial [marine sediment metagenome]
MIAAPARSLEVILSHVRKGGKLGVYTYSH